MHQALLDTDTLSDIMKGRDLGLLDHARRYLEEHGQFTFSLITRYEILRGLKAKSAERQIALFNDRCQKSELLPLTETVVEKAADIYAELQQKGQLITDADILIAATALDHHLVLVTGNKAHFKRITGLDIESWHTTPAPNTDR